MRDPELLFQQAVACHQAGNVIGAIKLYRDLMKEFPKNSQVLYLLGVAEGQNGNLQACVALLGKALKINPDDPEAHYHRGMAFQDLGRTNEALRSYDHAIQLQPMYPEAHNNRGVALQDQKRWKEALQSFDRAIQLAPDYPEAHNNRGLALKELKCWDDASQSYDRALQLRFNYPEAHSNRGVVLHELKRLNEALQSYDRALQLAPDYAEVHRNRGLALKELKYLDEALQSYDRAIQLKPDYAEAHGDRGLILQELKRWDEALHSYGNAIKLKPDYEFLYGDYIHVGMHLCEWKDATTWTKKLVKLISSNEKASAPFNVQSLLDEPQIQNKCASIFTVEHYSTEGRLQNISKYDQHNKIRIAYLSADFGDHPVTHLLAGLIEEHDRSKFEVVAFSLALHQGKWRDRVAHAFDQFIDVQSKSDKEIALLARSMEIDIAIDLNGYTHGCRTGTFAERAAPIQISYIGFLGTMGAPYIDYLIADKTIIPEGNKKFYAEKIAYLPTYQCNDDKQIVSDRVFTRKESGLPAKGFVFCCFNANYKITPAVFESWMRILIAVPDSVLWLYVGNETAITNLKKEATNCGVEGSRLVFAEHLPLEEHLSRERLADLFLDTYPYNAGATASNALRIGLPVLTRSGDSFASRVGASLLNAVGLPELITSTLAEYEALAVHLATDQNKFMHVKNKLVDNLPTCSLFNTKKFVRNIEFIYAAMYASYQGDLSPDHIDVSQ